MAGQGVGRIRSGVTFDVLPLNKHGLKREMLRSRTLVMADGSLYYANDFRRVEGKYCLVL